MNDLLAGYEEDLGIKDTNDQAEDFDDGTGSTIAHEVNLLKQVSEQQLEVALRQEMSLSHGESIDQYMNTTQCEQKMQQIDAQKALEIAALNKNDPEYAAKVK